MAASRLLAMLAVSLSVCLGRFVGAQGAGGEVCTTSAFSAAVARLDEACPQVDLRAGGSLPANQLCGGAKCTKEAIVFLAGPCAGRVKGEALAALRNISACPRSCKTATARWKKAILDECCGQPPARVHPASGSRRLQGGNQSKVNGSSVVAQCRGRSGVTTCSAACAAVLIPYAAICSGVARPRANKLARLARACKGGVTPAMPKNGTKEYYESLRCPAGQSRPPVWTFKVVKEYPHDVAAYTEGLLFHPRKGSSLGAPPPLYEATGSQSGSPAGLRKVNVTTGAVTKSWTLPQPSFGEGITILNGLLYELCWKCGSLFIHNASTFQLIETVPSFTNQFRQNEGWSFTDDGESLLLSDGSYNIYKIDPSTKKVTQTMKIPGKNPPFWMNTLWQINELEYVEGTIYYNVWQTDYIGHYDVKRGCILRYINFSGLKNVVTAAFPRRYNMDAVLNGIAWYDALPRDHLVVGGKWWPSLFEVELVAP